MAKSEDDSKINRHKQMAMGKEIKVMKKGGKVKEGGHAKKRGK